MADEKMVTVELKRTFRKGVNSYGPGEAEMPESLARALGVHPDQQKAAAPKATAKAPAKKEKK